MAVAEATTARTEAPRYLLVLEQSLGNASFGATLEAAVDPADFAVLRIESDVLSPLRNWSLRASLAARLRLRRARPKALLFHTQCSALLSVGLMRSIPTVISLDATPLNFDEVGRAYDHKPDWAALEAVKTAVNRRALQAAAAVAPFSDWAARSVRDGYRVPPARVRVVKPGVDLSRFRPGANRGGTGPLKVLFVGGDFTRKGGPELLAAAGRLAGRVELDVVTSTNLEPPPGLRCRVHRLPPGSPGLLRLFGEADVFALPTHADCSPLAVLEAMAAGLPVVTCPVGAVPEMVDASTGTLVPPGDVDALAGALAALVDDPGRRLALGARARQRAAADHDATRQTGALLDLLREVAG